VGLAVLLAGGAATAALVGHGGVAQAQKPPALGAPAPQPPPPPPPPQAGQTDKFGMPVTPAPAPTAQGQTDKFGLPRGDQPGTAAPPAPPPPAARAAPPAAPPPPQAGSKPLPLGPSQQAAPPPAAATPPAPPTAQATPPAAPPPPADEPEMVRTLRRLLGPEVTLGYGSAQVTDPATGAVRLLDVTLQRPGGRLGMEELTLDGLRDDGVTEAMARGVTVRDDDGTSARVERVRIQGLAVRKPAPGQELAPDAISLDALRIEGLTVEGETPVAVASASVEDYGPGRTSRIGLEGLEVRQPNGGMAGPVDRVSLGRMSVRGLDLASSFAALAAEKTPPRPAASWAVELEDIGLGGDGRPVGGMESFRLTGDSPTSGPETGRLAVRAIRVEPFPGLEEWLQRFGYTALIGDLNAESRYDRAAGRMEISSISLAGRDIGAISFSMALDGATPEVLESQDLDQMRLVSFGLRYVDQSLYGRFVRQQARQMRQTEQQVRQQLAQQAGAALAAEQGKDSPAMASIRTAVQRFLRGEAKEVEISARPPQPLAFSAIQGAAGGSPAEVQRMLGLSATAR
jgi:hypothetical protein